MRILILTFGTRGDCQPFVALAHALQSAGHTSLIVTNPEHEDLCTGVSVPFQSNETPFKPFFTSRSMSECFQSDSFMQFLTEYAKYCKEVGPSLYKNLHKAIESFKPDLAVCGTMHWFDIYWIARLFRVPALIFTLSNPHTQDDYEAPYKLPSLPCGSNGVVWRLVFYKYTSGMWEGGWSVLPPLAGEPAEAILPDSTDVLDMAGRTDRFSFFPYVVCEDKTNKSRGHVDKPWFKYTGALTLPAHLCRGTAFGNQSDELTAFLAAGSEPPIYFGWGSLKTTNPADMTTIAVRALKLLHRRGIILGGWASLSLADLDGQDDEIELKEYCKEHVIFVGAANHTWLFPQCAVLVHHGGLGTVAAASRSGRPSVVTPLFYDQFTAAHAVQSQGHGVGMQDSLLKQTAQSLAAAISTCLTDDKIKATAAEHAKQLLAGDAAHEAVVLLEDFMKKTVQQGDYWTKMDALFAKKKEDSAASRCSLM